MAKGSKEAAEARFAKVQARAQEAARAMNDAAAEAKRIDNNTARLKALRLARDAKLAEEAAVVAEAKAVAAEAKAVAVEAKVAAKAAKDAAKATKAAKTGKKAAAKAKAKAKTKTKTA